MAAYVPGRWAYNAGKNTFTCSGWMVRMDTSMSHELSNLRKFVAPEILFGAGARKAVANYARTFGARKVLLVSDPCSMRVHCAAKSCACG